jgi:signal transduction histidine kinase
MSWRETSASNRWIRAQSTAVPIFTDHEIGQMAIALTFGVIGLVGGAVIAGAIHPLDHPLPGDDGLAAAIVATTGIPVLVAALWRPQLFVRHLPIVAFGGATSLTLDAALVGPTFAPFVTMSYLWLQLMASVFLSRRLSHILIVTIAAQYAVVLSVQDHNPAPFTQWALTVTAVAVTGYLGAALVESVQTTAVAEHELRSAVEQKRYDLEVASQRKSSFLASMSHELRTPLNAIIGFTEMLGSGLRGPLNDKQAEYVDDIRASGAHLVDLIGEVLDVDAVESGHDALDVAPIEIGPLLAACVSLFRDQADRRGVKLRLLVGDDAHSVVADERKVRQVVLNLLANAMKHTPRGGRIEVQSTRRGGDLCIGVLDTGPGIDRGDRERIFEEFRQGANQSGASGTGLGLPLSRRIARLHGGDLTLDSSHRPGSAFWISLPLEGPMTQTSGPVHARAPRPRTKGVLHVTPRPKTELLGSVALFLLLPAALLSLPRPLPEGLEPVPLSLVVLAAAGYRLVLGVLPVSAGTKALLFTALGTVATTAAAAFVGPRLAPFVVMFYLWLGTTAIAYLSTRDALSVLLLAGAAYALLLVAQEGHTLPFIRWELTMGTVVLAAMIVRRMVDKLWEIAEDERMAREEIEGANAELDLAYRHKSEFLSNMSHELRTPLNVVIGFAEVLSSEAFGPLTPQQAEYVDEIVNAGRQLLALVNDVLDLGKLEAGRMERTPEPVLLQELIEPAFDEAIALAAEHGVDLTSYITDQPSVIEVDHVTVRRAVAALAKSAVLATPPGRRCNARASVDSEGLVVVVDDGGPPLSLYERRQLLVELVGATEGHDTQQALRLALASRFAALNGGALTAVPGARTGNRWTLTVPSPVLSRQ